MREIENSFFTAVARGQLTEIKRIINQEGKDILTAKDEIGQTPLHSAVVLGELEVAEALLSAGADPIAKSSQGFTPLEFSVNCYTTGCRTGPTAEKQLSMMRLLVQSTQKIQAKETEKHFQEQGSRSLLKSENTACIIL